MYLTLAFTLGVIVTAVVANLLPALIGEFTMLCGSYCFAVSLIRLHSGRRP